MTEPGVERTVRIRDGKVPVSLIPDLGNASLGSAPRLANAEPVTTANSDIIIGLDSKGRSYRAGANNTLQRFVDGEAWATLNTFTRSPTGVRELPSGVLLCGTADDYPANTIKAALWRSEDDGATWTKVLDADDYQQSLALTWGYGAGANGVVLVSEYDSKAPGSRSAQQRIWLSTDHGVSFTPIYDHGTGTVGTRHVHGVTYDPYRDAIWATLGDYAAPGDGARKILVSWDRGGTWTTVTERQQPTSIGVFPRCIVFGSDSVPNGVLRIDDPSPTNLLIRQAYQINSSTALSHVAESPYQSSTELLFPFSVARSGEKGFVLGTRDGYSWYTVWDDVRVHEAANRGPKRALGPLPDGSYIISGNDANGQFQVAQPSSRPGLIDATAEVAAAIARQIPRRAYIAVSNVTSPAQVVPNGTWATINLKDTAQVLDDTSELFLISNNEIIAARPCLATITGEVPVTQSSTIRPRAALGMNGVRLYTAAPANTITRTIKMAAGDRVSIMGFHEGTGTDNTLSGATYCLIVDATEL